MNRALLLSPRNTSHLHMFTFFTWRLSHHPGSISDDARLEHDHWRCSLRGLDQRWQRCSLGRNLSFDHWRCSLGGLDQRRCTGPDRWRCSNLGSISELLAVTVPRWQTSNFADHIIEWLHVVDYLVCLLALLRWLHSAAWLSKVGKWLRGDACLLASLRWLCLTLCLSKIGKWLHVGVWAESNLHPGVANSDFPLDSLCSLRLIRYCLRCGLYLDWFKFFWNRPFGFFHFNFHSGFWNSIDSPEWCLRLIRYCCKFGFIAIDVIIWKNFPLRCFHLIFELNFEILSTRNDVWD